MLAAGLVQTRYTVVLTRSPVEAVRVFASAVPLSESTAAAGGKNILLNGSEVGATLFFDRTNWFIPQVIVVSAHRNAAGADDDFLAQGRHSAIIQHVVIQGGSPDDGGEYDNLPVPSVVADVIDNDTASVVIVQSGEEPSSEKASATSRRPTATRSS